jgi:hypothetical protein
MLLNFINTNSSKTLFRLFAAAGRENREGNVMSEGTQLLLTSFSAFMLETLVLTQRATADLHSTNS